MLFRMSLFKTLYFNLKYLSFKQAIHLPILIARKVSLRKFAGSVILDCNPKIGIVKIGFGDVGIFDYKGSRSIWEVNGKVIFRGKANIGHGSKISVGKDGCLYVGDNFVITAESTIICAKEVVIGNGCLFSWDILVMDTDFHKIYDENGQIINEPRGIEIGDNTWIGCRSVILKGVKLPKNTIIGANSVVSKNCSFKEDGTLIAGIPAHVLKKNICWLP
jgi:acetyltransferase-like isoleucine patch superfamily enzyme